MTVSGSSRSRLAASVLGACLVLSTLPAGAAPTAAEKETARKLVKSGRAKLKAGDLKAALEDLKAAHAIMGVPTTGLALGKAQIAADRLVEARDTLLAVTRIPKEPREPRQFIKARAEAEKLAKEIEPRVPQLSIALEGAPEQGVRVAVDGVDVKQAALSAPLSLNPGDHEVVATLEGREKRTEVNLIEGQKSELVLNVSGLVQKKAPQEAPSKESVNGGTSPWVYVGFGVASVGTVVGSVTGLMAMSKKSSVDEECVAGRCPPSTHDDIDAGRTLGTVSTVSFVLAGAGAAVGVWALLGDEKPPSDSKPNAPSAAVWFGAGSAGVRGRF